MILLFGVFYYKIGQIFICRILIVQSLYLQEERQAIQSAIIDQSAFLLKLLNNPKALNTKHIITLKINKKDVHYQAVIRPSCKKGKYKGQPRIDIYSLNKTLGMGAQGKVYELLATLATKPRNPDNPSQSESLYCKTNYEQRLWAIKLFKSKEHAKAELKNIMAANNIKVKHKLVRFISSYDRQEYFGIVMEKAGELNLNQLIDRNSNPELTSDDPLALTTEDLFDLTIGAAKGIENLHDNNFVHRDIKPANFVVAKIDGKFKIKLIDLGIAKEKATNDVDKILGTLSYLSPETLKKYGTSDKSDVFGFALIILYLWGDYCVKTMMLAYFYDKKNSIPSFSTNANISAQLKERMNNLLQRMLIPVPDFRPDMKEILTELTHCFEEWKVAPGDNNSFVRIDKPIAVESIPDLFLLANSYGFNLSDDTQCSESQNVTRHDIYLRSANSSNELDFIPDSQSIGSDIIGANTFGNITKRERAEKNEDKSSEFSYMDSVSSISLNSDGSSNSRFFVSSSQELPASCSHQEQPPMLKFSCLSVSG